MIRLVGKDKDKGIAAGKHKDLPGCQACRHEYLVYTDHAEETKSACSLCKCNHGGLFRMGLMTIISADSITIKMLIHWFKNMHAIRMWPCRLIHNPLVNPPYLTTIDESSDMFLTCDIL